MLYDLPDHIGILKYLRNREKENKTKMNPQRAKCSEIWSKEIRNISKVSIIHFSCIEQTKIHFGHDILMDLNNSKKNENTEIRNLNTLKRI